MPASPGWAGGHLPGPQAGDILLTAPWVRDAPRGHLHSPPLPCLIPLRRLPQCPRRGTAACPSVPSALQLLATIFGGLANETDPN